MGGRGFPTLLWLDAEGGKLAEQSDRSVDAFQTTGKALTTLQQLKDKQDRSAADEVELFLARVALGQLNLADAKAGAEKLQATGEHADRIAAALLDLEIADAMAGVRSQEQAIAAGKQFADMVKNGRSPKKPGIPTAQFWMMLGEHAKDTKDAKLFEQCVANVKQALGNEKSYQRLFDNLDKDLAELQKDG